MDPIRAKVDRVIDGDTMWVRVRVRTQTSAPGARARGGAAATAELAKRFPRGADLSLIVLAVDQFGRIVARV